MWPVALTATITEVQPMTGIALWTTNPEAATAPIQLEYGDLASSEVVDSQGRYGRNPRLAFVQVGFGLWAEYHIYDGPMSRGETFASLEFQRQLFGHLATCFREIPWMISLDAAGSQAPLVGNPRLLAVRFGLFDDSFNHRRHAEENEPNCKALGPDRWKTAPAGGEFRFFTRRDQKQALAPAGPSGIPFEEQASRFHVSFIIGDDQPRFQVADRIRAAGLACGYRFRVSRFAASATASAVVTNVGIAPIYHTAFPTVNGVRSRESLAGLLPGASKRFIIEVGDQNPTLTIESDRLVPGQRIGHETAAEPAR